MRSDDRDIRPHEIADSLQWHGSERDRIDQMADQDHDPVGREDLERPVNQKRATTSLVLSVQDQRHVKPRDHKKQRNRVRT